MIEAIFYIYFIFGVMFAVAYQMDFGDQFLVPLLLIFFWPIIVPLIGWIRHYTDWLG